MNFIKSQFSAFSKIQTIQIIFTEKWILIFFFQLFDQTFLNFQKNIFVLNFLRLFCFSSYFNEKKVQTITKKLEKEKKSFYLFFLVLDTKLPYYPWETQKIQNKVQNHKVDFLEIFFYTPSILFSQKMKYLGHFKIMKLLVKSFIIWSTNKPPL